MEDKSLRTGQTLPEDEEDRQTQRKVNEWVKKWGALLVISGWHWS
jgi:hypothetical protein